MIYIYKSFLQLLVVRNPVEIGNVQIINVQDCRNTFLKTKHHLYSFGMYCMLFPCY